MLKGINQWCFPEGTTLEKVFEYSKNAGFDAVELNVNPKDGIGLTMDTTIQEAEKIVQIANTFGLKLRSLSNGLLSRTPLSAKDEMVRAKGRKVILKQVELASVMGIDTVLVVPGRVTKETSYDECYVRSQGEIEKIIPYAEQMKVSLGIENVWNKFLLSPLEMARYIDEFASEYVGAYFDVGNVLQIGYPEQWIQILGKRIRKVHVKDFKTRIGNITGFVPLLAGDVNWSAVIQELDNIGFTDTITAELSPYKIGPEPLAHDTARQMDIILEYSQKIKRSV